MDIVLELILHGIITLICQEFFFLFYILGELTENCLGKSGRRKNLGRCWMRTQRLWRREMPLPRGLNCTSLPGMRLIQWPGNESNCMSHDD